MKSILFQRGTALALLSLALTACGTQQASVPAAQAQGPAQAGLLGAQTLDTASQDNETPQLWFVELASAPTADGGSLSATENDKRNFRAEARQQGLKYTERRAFGKLFNGLSVRVAPGELARLSRLGSVKAIYPVESIKIPETEQVNEPEMTTALAMTGADVAQNELGLTGKGVKVAVMDTGIDKDHPAFDYGKRIVASYDFVGDAYTGSNDPVPGGQQDDCAGHGTHVAGIVGGNDAGTGFKGVAPEVSFGAYRVFGCAGSTQADIMIAAMERALDDGMQVLNMSIGSAFQTWPEYPTAKAATRLVNKGVAVVASIGNSGASGAFSAGAPGVGDKVIGVASFDNTHVLQNQFTISPDGAAVGYQQSSPSPTAPISGSLTFKATGTPTTANDACNAVAPAPNSLTGQAALIRRGSCTFYEKALNAQKAGAAAVVLYNNTPGPFAGSLTGAEAITIPVVTISAADGVTIYNRLANNVALTWTAEKGSFLNTTGDLLSGFSSYGLAADLSLKPDIGGPGGLIRSAWPLSLDGTGYNTISGTSMSSPHVAGTVALLLQAKPNTPSQAVRTILQNSANPKPWSGNRNAGYLDFVHRQGAGMVDIVRAVEATTRVEPGKLSLGESESGPATRTLTVSNQGKSAVTYTLSHAPALSSGGLTNSPSPALGYAAASFSTPTVTVPAGGTATVNVTITANSGLADRSQYGGYVVFTPAEGSVGSVVRVPYAGIKGDYQSIQVLTPTTFNFPWLGKLSGTSYSKQADGATYTLKDGDQPYFLAHLEHQSRLLRAEVYDASGKYLGRAFGEEYLGRSGSATGFSAFTFDGTTTKGKQTYDVPNGRYTVKLMVLKALGDENNPAHWETWQSPTFTIAR